MGERKKWSDNLKPLSTKKLKKYDFVGFDVETVGEDNLFYMGGLYYYDKYGKAVYKSFFNKLHLIDELCSRKFQGKYIVATNLNFDLTAVFYNSPEWNELDILKQSSNIIHAVYKPYKNVKKGSIKYLDTFNFLKSSVENLGKILGKHKLEKPACLGRLPNNNDEKTELVNYNKRDCEISCDIMYLIQKGLNEAGGNLKITIASSSFDVWRRNFLDITLVKEEVKLNDNKIKDFIFEGYYGGRTEVFKRGRYENVYYYDINSLYPSVMARFNYPLPQSVEKINKPVIDNVLNYEGVSKVIISCPEGVKPFLPYKYNKKLIFPSGQFYGTYNHNELRKALEIGYKIHYIDKQIIYATTFKPFKKFVEHFYSKRMEFKEKGSELEIIMKLILNSLYGKFGQKRITTSTIIKPDEFAYDTERINKLMCSLENQDYITNDNGDILYNTEEEYNGINVYPIIASYVTSYARILMYEYIKHDEVIYTDTDSCVSSKPLFSHSKELGKMKLEGEFDYGIFIKPKMYMLENKDHCDVKVKGLPKATKEDFLAILNEETVTKIKFCKLNEAFRRGLSVNQTMSMIKQFSLEDNKRVWKGNESTPIKLNEVYNE